MKKDIRDLSLEELVSEMTAMEEPRHRAKQISKWLYSKGALSFEEMTDLPAALIKKLGEKFTARGIINEELRKSTDGTMKFLWKLPDGAFIESVMIPAGERRTVCVSTQAGCKFRCPFCASGQKGFLRNLSPGEITGQVIMVQRETGERVTNVVFMGMGEPLDNFPNLARAIRTMNRAEGMGIAARKITVSTCGLVPGIRQLKDLGLQIELSVSLHASNDKLRDVLVPVNRKYPVAELVSALQEYFADTGRVITLEYALIKNVNDSVKDAEQLAGIARKIKAKINLIRCNFAGSKDFEASSERAAEVFRRKLQDRGVTSTLRRSRGADIEASCGQLAAARAKNPEKPI